jgi:hypothetical protein
VGWPRRRREEGRVQRGVRSSTFRTGNGFGRAVKESEEDCGVLGDMGDALDAFMAVAGSLRKVGGSRAAEYYVPFRV